MSYLKIGDVVTLKSGGVVMTLGEEMGSGQWSVYWFAGAELKTGTVPLTSLKAAPGPR
jgi:uncharacterized protein YodC (DUF2158 family)